MRKRPFAFLIPILAFAILLAGCTASSPAPLETVSLKLTWEHSAQFLGFYVAEAQGFYADEGLTLTATPLLDMSEIGQIPVRVAAGEFDFGVASRSLIDNQTQSDPAVAISTIIQLNPNAFFARADTGITTPADLAGHRIATKGDASRLILAEFLATADLTLEDVEEVPSGFDMTPFYEGDVDVWLGLITDEVIQARQRGLELVTFPLYEYGIQETTLTLFTSQQIVNTNPELAVRFLRASLRGWQWALDHPVEAVNIMLILYPELATDREFHLASFNAYIPLVQPPGRPLGELDCQQGTSEKLCTTAILETIWQQE